MTASRKFIRQRANGICEYCRIPEQFTTFRFQLDHVISRKHLGSDLVENLAWACAECNSYKGSDLAGLDPLTGKLERLFNPRLDQWDANFSWEGPNLVGKTPEGRVTIHVLRINRPERLALRRELMAANLFIGRYI